MTKTKQLAPCEQLEVLKGMPDMYDITEWIASGKADKVIVVLTCAIATKKSVVSDILELRIVFKKAGLLTDKPEPLYWSGDLEITDERYEKEKRIFYVDEETNIIHILARGSDELLK